MCIFHPAMITPPGNASCRGSLGGRSRGLTGKLNNFYFALMFFIFTFYSRTFLHRATTGDIDYIENQCVVEEVDTSCKYEVYEGQDIGYADIQVQASSAKEVRDSVNMQLIWASRLKRVRVE